MLDALARWYRAPPAVDDGLALALDHARRLLRPGSRLLVLADAASVAGVADARWSSLAMHHEVLVLLLVDPLERAPPLGRFAFLSSGGQRTEVDLGGASQRRGWHARFEAPIETELARLPARGVHVSLLSSDAASDAWLPAFARRGS